MELSKDVGRVIIEHPLDLYRIVRSGGGHHYLDEPDLSGSISDTSTSCGWTLKRPPTRIGASQMNTYMRNQFPMLGHAAKPILSADKCRLIVFASRLPGTAGAGIPARGVHCPAKVDPASGTRALGGLGALHGDQVVVGHSLTHWRHGAWDRWSWPTHPSSR